jgi:hypothetical protein
VSALPASFFTASADDEDPVFTATVATRGPWSDQHQHGGPSAALLARALGRWGGDGMRVARFGVVFHRPLAIASYRVKVESLREGKKVRIARASLLPVPGASETIDAKAVAVAEALLVRRERVLAEGPATAIVADGMPRPDASEPFVFPFFRAPIGYHVAMETRVFSGRFGEGRMGLWMRMRVPLLEGETPGPLERVACASDSGNGVSVGVDVTRFTFLNPEMTFALAREPVGEWIGVDAGTTFGEDGIGLADTRLLDARGVIGRALQPLLLERR